MHQFRDIHQLRNAPPFGITAIDGLLTIEHALANALRHVPYCEEHLNVWSHNFAGIILEAASQLDSIWKASAKLESPSVNDERLNITHHRDKYSDVISTQKVVLFASSSPVMLMPFEEWQTINSPNWWLAYNALKHDRFSNQSQATLGHAVNTVAALLLGIVYSGYCDCAIVNANLLDASHYNPWAFTKTGKLCDATAECCSKVETILFAHPLGIESAERIKTHGIWMTKSARFNAWWALNFDKLFPDIN